ncbi:hypothetical protein SAMN04515679_1476 [Pelosinus fermentans]|uniref:Uncharacterized protein n=1 Tax=Pelosinus fermentans B4 TaxID=1149862 RepID=I9LJA1_9FIRM|nr:hypothetical protein FB4_2233 [Pelosinus fermentans B4]EIW25671.1 hypothetical protein FA11_2293 [Pelosinus fermentans A11]OAM93394.1 hypothetical protein FR7_01410 [Pelosinus fermentans DSM 17108]SDQ76264.1 hypothetical protein SAMN04515679_1476 [Pelosinus fermentans]
MLHQELLLNGAALGAAFYNSILVYFLIIMRINILALEIKLHLQ